MHSRLFGMHGCFSDRRGFVGIYETKGHVLGFVSSCLLCLVHLCCVAFGLVRFASTHVLQCSSHVGSVHLLCGSSVCFAHGCSHVLAFCWFCCMSILQHMGVFVTFSSMCGCICLLLVSVCICAQSRGAFGCV